jgi:hypothetical protein
MQDETGPGGGTRIYRENVHFSPGVALLVLVLIILYIAITIGAIVKHIDTTAIVFGIIAVLLLALLANFWRLVFVITEDKLAFGFGFIKKTFDLSDLVSCEPYALTFGNYYGYGIRFGRDGTIAYNTRNGPGIKLVINGVAKPYVISVNNSGYVCKLLNEVIDVKVSNATGKDEAEGGAGSGDSTVRPGDT